MTVDVRQFRSALGSFATGITIVTTRTSSGEDVGLTVNSFNSVSLEPPMVLWSLAKKSRSRQAFLDSGYFAVHILSVGQSELATRFASPTDRFKNLVLDRNEQNLPLLQGCAARFHCKTISCYEGGDHDIFIGEVIAFENFERSALVLQAGRYAVALEKPEYQASEEEAQNIGVERNSITYLLVQAYHRLQFGIRSELARYNLSEAEHYILATVALISPCTADQIGDRMAISGYRVTQEDVQRLMNRNLLSVTGKQGSDCSVQLTKAGREIVLHIAVMTKVIEEDAVTDLQYTEIDILKELLRKIVHRTQLSWQHDAAMPDSTKSEGARRKPIALQIDSGGQTHRKCKMQSGDGDGDEIPADAVL